MQLLTGGRIEGEQKVSFYLNKSCMPKKPRSMKQNKSKDQKTK